MAAASYWTGSQISKSHDSSFREGICRGSVQFILQPANNKITVDDLVTRLLYEHNGNIFKYITNTLAVCQTFDRQPT